MNNDVCDAGLAGRKTVLGRQHVERSLDNTAHGSKDIRNVVANDYQGEICAGAAFDLETASIIKLAMFTALDRLHEIELQARGTFNAGRTEAELGEVSLATGIHCGVPAALDSFRLAQRVFAASAA